MAAPNIVNVTDIYGKLAFQAITTSATAIVENTAASGKVLKINTLIISNVDGANAANVTVDVYRSTTATHIIKGVSVAQATAFTAIDKTVMIYLEEGDSLRLTASANGDLEAVCSYEEIS